MFSLAERLGLTRTQVVTANAVTLTEKSGVRPVVAVLVCSSGEVSLRKTDGEKRQRQRASGRVGSHLSSVTLHRQLSAKRACPCELSSPFSFPKFNYD